MDEAEVAAEQAAEEAKVAAKEGYADFKEIRAALVEPYLKYEECLESFLDELDATTTPMIEEA